MLRTQLLVVAALIVLGVTLAASSDAGKDEWEEDAQLLDTKHEDAHQNGYGSINKRIKEAKARAEASAQSKAAVESTTGLDCSPEAKCNIIAQKVISVHPRAGGRRLLGKGTKDVEKIVKKAKEETIAERKRYVACCVAESKCRTDVKDMAAKTPKKLIQMIEAQEGFHNRRLLGGDSRRRVSNEGLEITEKKRMKRREAARQVSLRNTEKATKVAAKRAAAGSEKKAKLEKVAAAAKALEEELKKCLKPKLPADYKPFKIGHC